MLSIVDVCKGYRRGDPRVQALRGVSLGVAAGEIVGILGPRNGGGTTSLEVVAGWVQPDVGQIGDHDLYVLDDHQPPRFHARSREFNAKIRTDTLELLVGDLPRRELRLVLAWAELHAYELQANWVRARAGETLLEIESLQ